MQQVVIGTAGHIDHGKTALVKALTGIDTDTLLQEKNRGITIDLGFAYLNEKITIVDVPGHQKFIRNMVAGASTIHLGLLVVAANDGVMPQTLEHLHILDSLAIINGIIVITKIDTVDEEWIEMVIQDIEKFKKGTVLSSSKIIKVDSLSGKGVNNLKENQESIIKSLLKRNIDYSNEINKAIELDEQRKKIQTDLDSLLSESNTIAKSIGDLFKSGKIEEANSLKEKSTQIKPRIKAAVKM